MPSEKCREAHRTRLDSNHRTALPVRCDERRRHPRDSSLNLQPLLLRIVGKKSRGFVFPQRGLSVRPDPIAQFDELSSTLLDRNRACALFPVTVTWPRILEPDSARIKMTARVNRVRILKSRERRWRLARTRHSLAAPWGGTVGFSSLTVVLHIRRSADRRSHPRRLHSHLTDLDDRRNIRVVWNITHYLGRVRLKRFLEIVYRIEEQMANRDISRL